MQIEKYVESEVVKAARLDGWMARRLQWRDARGAPDYLFIKNGRVVFVEFKSPGEKPRPDQIYEHNEIRAYGGEVHTVDSVPAGLKVLEIEA